MQFIFPINMKTFLKNTASETAHSQIHCRCRSLLSSWKNVSKKKWVCKIAWRREDRKSRNCFLLECYMKLMRAAAVTIAFSSSYRNSVALPSRSVAIPLLQITTSQLGLQPVLWMQPVRTPITWRTATRTTAWHTVAIHTQIHTHCTKALELVMEKLVLRANEVDKAWTNDWYHTATYAILFYILPLTKHAFLKIALFHSFSCLKNYAILLINSGSLNTDLESLYARRLHRNIYRAVKL